LFFICSHVSGNDPKVLNQETYKNLKGKVKNSIESAPGWNETLASESEATVKADRHDRHNSVAVEELQRQSVTLMEEHYYEPQEQSQSTSEKSDSLENSTLRK
jgi:hypothetical protein